MFFTGLVSVSFFKLKVENHFLQGILELITIPFIIITVALFVVNLRKWLKEKTGFEGLTFYTLIFLTFSIFIMLTATIFNV